MELTTYNPLDILQSPEEVRAYLNEAFMDDDPKVFIIALGYVVKRHGIANIAKATGLNRENLYKTFSGQANPRWSTLSKVLNHLNIKLKAC